MTEEINHIEKINDIIRAVTEEATFSSGAMKQFIALKDEVEDQERTIKYLRGVNKDKELEIQRVKGERDDSRDLCTELRTEVENWHQRASELHDREEQANILQTKLDCQIQRVEDHQNMVGLVFRNAEIRKRVIGEELSHYPGHAEMKDQYGNVQQYHEPAGFRSTPVKKDEIETQE